MTQGRNPLVRLWTGFWRIITWLRVATFNVLFLAVVLLVGAAIFSPDQLPLPKEGPLLVTPSGFLVDEKSYQSPATLLMEPNSQYPSETVVRDLVDAIDAAAADHKITALVLDLNYLSGGALSKLEEVGQALQTFQRSGKPIIAYGDSYTQSQYYLASYADEVYLNEMGAVLLTGFSLYQHYMQEGLDKLDVNVHVFRVGEYKDFVEPFIRNSMSEASRRHNTQWISELWNVYTSRIETARQLPAGAVNDFINNMDSHLAQVNGDTAQLAVAHGLVDQVTSRVAVRDMLMARFGADYYGENFNAIPHEHYLAQQRSTHRAKADRVGLIVASGGIVDGEQPQGSIGSDTFVRLVRAARQDDQIKAVVVRVDSGGGSALASEVIRQELEAMRAAGKPVIISMGSMAASGGYWMSAPADEIWATPTTLTGSIGVFGVLPTFEETLESLGLHVDGIATTELAGADRLDLALSEKAERVAQASVEAIYQRFLTIVADAREKTIAEVHELAQGRVWTGATAMELGLVDRLGYLRDAVTAAAEKAGISEYSLEVIETPLSPFEQVVRAVRGEGQALASRLEQSVLASFLGGMNAPGLGSPAMPTTGGSAAAGLWRGGLAAEQEGVARFFQQIQSNLAPLTRARANGVYAQCTQCASL